MSQNKELIKLVMDLGKDQPAGFSVKDFETAVILNGMSFKKSFTFALTNLKRAGYISNIDKGMWALTKRGMSIGDVTDSFATRVSKFSNISRDKKKDLRNKKYNLLKSLKTKAVNPVASSKLQQPPVASSKERLIDLMLEIRSKKPDADISCLINKL